MDKIWDRYPSWSKLIGRCGGDDHAEPTKVERLKNNTKGHCKGLQLKGKNTSLNAKHDIHYCLLNRDLAYTVNNSRQQHVNLITFL